MPSDARDRQGTAESVPVTCPATTFIYALLDPRDGSVRYVGTSDDPTNRVNRHVLTRKEKNARGRWVSELWALGLEPKLEVLEEVAMVAWRPAERKWIERMREKHALVNTLDGGNGGGGGAEPIEVKADVVESVVAYFEGEAGRDELGRIGFMNALRKDSALIQEKLTRMSITRIARRKFTLGRAEKVILDEVLERVRHLVVAR